MFNWDNSYARLPDRFFTKMNPTPVHDPEFITVNTGLAIELGLDPSDLTDALEVFSGNSVPGGAEPLAQLYAGHQFGGWSPQLGDGRALLLGEHVHEGNRWDIQLKGSGPTPYSRMGDGRSALGPVIREYLVSEAMSALGVPTTRALAAVRSGETVLRQEGPLPGGVLTRVAASHIRVGTFQVFASRGDAEAVQILLDHALARHFPDREGPMGLLRAVMEAQAKLVAQWMGLGFVHGVMNTDNMTISGETIDYGPCAFMESYHPDTVFSSIDQFGRYRWSRQPDIALWNLAQLATALLPVMGPRDAAVAEATETLDDFKTLFDKAWSEILGNKIGVDDQALALEFLEILASEKLDFTNSFRALTVGRPFGGAERLSDWRRRWEARQPDESRMRKANPAIIPRNHRVEKAIAGAYVGDLREFIHLNEGLRSPWRETDENEIFRAPARPEETVSLTYCGT